MYDKASAKSIYEFSLQLTGKSLAEMVQLPLDVENTRDRGRLGTLIEKYFFKHTPPNDHNPDFAEAGLELKVTGVIKAKNGSYKAKERLVLTMINFEELVHESWERSTFLTKCKKMLIMIYQFDSEVPVINRKFVLDSILYEIPDEDLPIIRQDWLAIQRKVQLGRAHELSEGDTFYLGACRKGAGGAKEALRKQPFSEIGAPARAFSFKQGYLNRLISDLQNEATLKITPEKTIEEATQERFLPYLGLSIPELSHTLHHFKKDKNHKNFHREIALKILAGSKSSVRELEGAGIEMKSVRLQKNGKPRESMSFPGFNFMNILNEEWEDSTFFEKIEKKFLFVVFQSDSDGVERLLGVKYWNMPYEDRVEARRVWSETKRRVAIDAFNLPGMTESSVAHVRPKARNGNDKALTPQGTQRTKQCFWLNASYIAGVLKEL